MVTVYRCPAAPICILIPYVFDHDPIDKLVTRPSADEVSDWRRHDIQHNAGHGPSSIRGRWQSQAHSLVPVLSATIHLRLSRADMGMQLLHRLRSVPLLARAIPLWVPRTVMLVCMRVGGVAVGAVLLTDPMRSIL